MSDLEYVFDDLTFEHADTESASPMRASYTVHNEFSRVADMHYHVEIGIVEKGTLLREYRNHRQELGPGDIWFNGIYEPHVCVTKTLPSELTVLVIDPAFLANTHLAGDENEAWLAPFLASPDKRPKCNSRQKKWMLEASQRFRSHKKMSEPEQMKWDCLLLFELLLTAGLPSGEAVNEQQTDSSSFPRLRRALELTLTSNERIDTDTAAQVSSMSRRNFDRLFTQCLGIPFTQFSLRCRLRKAARELVSTQKPLKTVASEFGFTDSSHLNNSFKAFFGQTPAQYRKTC